MATTEEQIQQYVEKIQAGQDGFMKHLSKLLTDDDAIQLLAKSSLSAEKISGVIKLLAIDEAIHAFEVIMDMKGISPVLMFEVKRGFNFMKTRQKNQDNPVYKQEKAKPVNKPPEKASFTAMPAPAKPVQAPPPPERKVNINCQAFEIPIEDNWVECNMSMEHTFSDPIICYWMHVGITLITDTGEKTGFTFGDTDKASVDLFVQQLKSAGFKGKKNPSVREWEHWTYTREIKG